MTRILLVDDEPSLLATLSAILEKQGYEVTALNSGAAAVSMIVEIDYDLILTDIKMVDVDGLQVLESAKSNQPQTPVLMITAHGSVETAVDALKIGAFDYVTKPFKVDELLMTVQRALDHHKVVVENSLLKNQLAERGGGIVSVSDKMSEVLKFAQQVAPIENPVLLVGEKGVGKEAVARFIHLQGENQDGFFMAVDCAEDSESVISSMLSDSDRSWPVKMGNSSPGGGTLLLNQIDALPPATQNLLLDAINRKRPDRDTGHEGKKNNLRIIAACESDPKAMASNGEFSTELLGKLTTLLIVIAPLRERRADIMPLLFSFLRQGVGAVGEVPAIDKAAKIPLEAYGWPGNVDELKGVAQEILATGCRSVGRSDLPAAIRDSTAYLEDLKIVDDARGRSLKAFLQTKEIEYIEYILDSLNGDINAAAESLHISAELIKEKLKGRL